MAIYELDPSDEGAVFNYMLPDQTVTESEKTPQWYAQNVRYVCNFYNKWPRNSFDLEQPNDPNGNNTGGGTTTPLEDPVQYMLRMMMYYLGRQPNLDYAHLTPNTTTTNLMPDWIRGQKIYTIITFMKDIMVQMMQNMDFAVKAMSEDAVADRKLLLDKLMIQHEMQDQLRKIEELGVTINSAQGQDFEMPEDVQYYVEEGYKDMDSEICTNIAQHLWLFNNCMSKFLSAFTHVNTAGQCGIEHYVANGNYYMDLHMPHQLIVDNRWDDDYNRKARFVGTIYWRTPEEIFSLHPEFTDKQRTEIRQMAYDPELGIRYNTMQNLVWWSYAGAQQIGTIAMVKGYWYTIHDLGKKKYENEYGVKKIVEVEEKDEVGGKMPGDYSIEDVCTATLIGNKYVLDYGYIDNIAEDYYNKSKPRLPVMVYKPNMLLGESRSVASRLHELQDERDAYKFKIREMVGNSVGKAYVVKGWKFGNGINTKELFQDLKSMRIHVATHSGEDDPQGDAEKSIEVIDMTMDPNVLALGQIINAIDAEMMEISKVSDTAMGQPQKYMGLGVMQAAMQNSSGSAYVYSGFMEYIQMNMQYGVDVCKYLYTEDETDYPQLIIGKRGIDYLKAAKKIRYCNPLLYLTVNDFIEEKRKQRLMEDAHAAMQTGDIRFIDVVNIDTAKTYTELKDKLIYSSKKADKQKERDAAFQAQMKQLMEENRNLTMQMQEMMRQMGSAQKQQMQNEGAIAGKVVDQAHAMMMPQQ